MRSAIRPLYSVIALTLGTAGACSSSTDDAAFGGGGGSESTTGAGAADKPAGTDVVVALVNPVVNDDNETAVPPELGLERDGLTVSAAPGGTDTTQDGGLAVVDVSAGAVALTVGGAPALQHQVVAAGDLYDAPLAYSGTAAAFFVNTPIRYAAGAGSGATFFDTTAAIGAIGARLSEPDVVVVLRPGTYVGDIAITGERVTLFGEGWSERAVVIDGSITVSGEGARIRGLTIRGDLQANGDEFGISYSVVHGAAAILGDGGVYLRNVFCGTATVPSSSATLLDNAGVAPLVDPPAGVCPE